MGRSYVKSNNSEKKKIKIALAIVAVVALLILGIRALTIEERYYLKNLEVCKAVIVEMNNEEGDYFVRISPDYSTIKSVLNISTDNLWIDVTSDFYIRKKVGEEVGVLLGNYDIFKGKMFGKGQNYKGNISGIENIYMTYDEAMQANPYKKFTAQALVNKKKITKDGKLFLVVNYDQRTFNIEVSKEVYDKYNKGQQVQGEFESLGESIKLLKII